jgi:hypothetical protein
LLTDRFIHSVLPIAMFRRYALGFSTVGRQFSAMASSSGTPMEDAIRAKVRQTHKTPLIPEIVVFSLKFATK